MELDSAAVVSRVLMKSTEMASVSYHELLLPPLYDAVSNYYHHIYVIIVAVATKGRRREWTTIRSFEWSFSKMRKTFWRFVLTSTISSYLCHDIVSQCDTSERIATQAA